MITMEDSPQLTALFGDIAPVHIVADHAEGALRDGDVFLRNLRFRKIFLQAVIPEKDPVAGAAIAIQTVGDLLGFNSIIIKSIMVTLGSRKQDRYAYFSSR
jgi:hypothetical protein